MRFALPNLYIADAPKPATFFGFLRHGIDEWVINARAHQIRSVICLLDDRELSRYRSIGGLMEFYRAAGFQAENIAVPDGTDPPVRLYELTSALRRLAKPIVIHANSEDDYRTKKAVKLLSEWDEE